MLDKSIYKQFYNYLTEGANPIIQKNRDRLEAYVRDSIDIDKSAEVFKKHKIKGDNFNISPETFLALSLIDELPSNVDLRLSPELKIDGIIFKNKINDNLIIKKVPYTKKVEDFLKLQISPNSEIEMNKSEAYTNNLINNLKLFDKIFRKEISSYKYSVFRRANALINNPTPFFNSIITCVVNEGRDFQSRITEHYIKTEKYQREFFSIFNRRIDKLKHISPSELTQENVYKIIYIIVLNKIFPKLSIEKIENIFEISLNVDKPIDYNGIKKIIHTDYKINRSFCKELKKCIYKKKNKGKLFLDLDLCFKNKYILEIIAGSNISSINNHSFFNFVLFIDQFRKLTHLKVRKRRNTSHPFVYTQLIDFCSDLEELAGIRKKAGNIPSIPLPSLYPDFLEYIQKSRVWDRLNNNIDFEWDTLIYNLNERFLNRLYPLITIYKKEKNKWVYEDNGRRKYSYEFRELIKDNIGITEFCGNTTAWNYHHGENTLCEITSGIDLTNIQNIGVANLLNFLFKDQVDDDYFQRAQYILFHKNLIIVSINGKLSTLMPSPAYNQFVLNKMGSNSEVALGEDANNIQLNRFLDILNNVLKENTGDMFGTESGDVFLEHLRSIVDIKFINTLDILNKDGMMEQHNVSLGSINSFEQKCFIDLLKDYSFLFSTKISEIYLSVSDAKKRRTIPVDEKELFFYIEQLRSDHDMFTKYFITHEDLILLGRSNRFILILLERAFSVIFNKEILCNDRLYAEFKEVIGNKNINISERYFSVRGKSMPQSRLIRKIFIQNSLLYIQNKRDKLTSSVIDFMDNVFNYSKQLTV